MNNNVYQSSMTFSPEKQPVIDEKISNSDPLNADIWLRLLPKLNHDRNVNELIAVLRKLMPFPKKLNEFDYYESAAAMRDIGMFLGSIKKLGAEPVEEIPELDYILDVLGLKTNLPPRDTLLHYTSWNPDGIRQRTYTGIPDEKNLIHSVKMAMNPLLESIAYLRALYETPLRDPKFAILSDKAALKFKAMVDGVVYAKRGVSPSFFANELRFYFDPIRIHGRIYLGPGAVEMPAFVFDHILWSSDCDDLTYNSFKAGYVPYILPQVREVYQEFENKKSLITNVCETLSRETHKDEVVDASAKSLLKLCQMLKSFRMPHKKLADESYGYENKAHRTKGSGGYSPEILDYIIKLCLAQINTLKSAYNQYAEKAAKV